MTVEVLRLTGLPAAEAAQATRVLLDDLRGHPDLRKLLVLDDTAMLVPHTSIYEQLVTGWRVEQLLCVAIGPRPRNSRQLQLPGNLGGTMGSGVLWVSDPAGIDWRVARSGVAVGRPGGPASGLERLVDLLLVDEVFDRVHTVMTMVPGGVASPGLRLAGADDEAVTFAEALAAAVRLSTEPAAGPARPFPVLLPAATGRAELADDGELARWRADVVESAAAADEVIGRLGGLSGMFGRGLAELRARMGETGTALAEFRRRVQRLLQDANAAGELTERQRELVRTAGVGLPAADPRAPDPAADSGPFWPSPVCRAIADALRSGDTLAAVAARLLVTERDLKRHGSGSYLREVERRCPPALASRLMDPPARLPRPARPGNGRGNARAELRRELGLEAAVKAPNDLADLVVTVANREWSAAAPAAAEVTRARIAMDGAAQALTSYAGTVRPAGRAGRQTRLSRLGEALTPVLGDLVLKVVAAESSSPSEGGQEAVTVAQHRADQLREEWTKHVRQQGVLSPPDFASGAVPEVQYSSQDDVGEIREAVLDSALGVMWQLCAKDELGALDAAATPQVVAFVPRLNRDLLAGALPPDTAWTSSGSYAGILRLVPLLSGLATSSWVHDPQPGPGGSAARPGPHHLTEAG